MFPPLIWLAFVILVAAIVAIGAFIAVRMGLWTRETSTHATVDDVPTRGRGARETGPRFERDTEDRPQHVTREDPTKSRFIGT